MKYLTLVLLFLTVQAQAQTPPNGVTHEVGILRVIDGDTVVIAAPYLPSPLRPELAVRIWGVDAPESGSRARCAAELRQSRLASQFVKQAVAHSTDRRVVLYSWDKYGGRVLGDVVLDGRSLREMLIEQGLVREYRGAARQSWCQ